MSAALVSLGLIQYMVEQVIASKYMYKGSEYKEMTETDYPRGKIVEFTDNEAGFCHSYVLIPGMSILPW